MKKNVPRRRGRPVSLHAAHRKLADELRRRMTSGKWGPGTTLPSLRALARDFNVGVDTVRAAVKVLRSEGRIGTTARRRLATSLSEFPTPAMTVAGSILQVVGFPFQKYLRNPEARAMQLGIETGAGELSAPLMITHGYFLQDSLPSGFLDLPLAGIVLCGSFNRSTLQAYARLNIPSVLADRPFPNSGIHTVAVDNVEAARDATARLIALGHRKIAFVRFVLLSVYDIDPDSRERQKGFERALKDAKIRARRDWIVNVLPQDTAESPSVRRIVQRGSGFTAALCVDGSRAEMLRQAARSSGRTIPRDFSIAAFSGAPDKSIFSGPCADFTALGLESVRLLQKPKSPPVHIRLATQWHEGTTLAAPAR